MSVERIELIMLGISVGAGVLYETISYILLHMTYIQCIFIKICNIFVDI